MLYLNYIVCLFLCIVLLMNVMLGCKNVSDILHTICYVLMQCQLKNKVCNVPYIVLSFMYIIFICCLIMCYIIIFAVIMLMGGFHYKLFNFFSILFPNMYISSCITCLYVHKLENKV